jgi:serine/threonine-protein kinase RsbW
MCKADKSVGPTRTRDQGQTLRTPEPILETRTRILDSTKESINFAGSQALEAARRGGFRETIVEHIGLAVHEIMTNAVIHGNRGNLQKKVVVTISRTPNKLKIEIADEGNGFNPDQLPDPLSPEGLLKGSGRGVYLARAFMDEFHVRREPVGWTTVTMAKSLDSAT